MLLNLRRRRRTVLVLATVLVTGAVLQFGEASPSRAADTLLSLNRSVTTSSVEDPTFPGSKAVDGNTSTRWASAEGADPQWIRVDLGSTATISRVRLNWEVAYGKDYTLQTSADGSTWTTIKTVVNGNGAIDDHTGLTATGRYLRVHGTKRGTSYGYSLWELDLDQACWLGGFIGKGLILLG